MPIKTRLGGLENENGPSRAAKAERSRVDATDVLDAIGSPIIVLDHDCAVSRFNQAAADTLHLSPSDVGRPLRDCAVLSNVEHLHDFCSRVIVAKTPSERQVRINDRWFVFRLSPYLGRDHTIGAVLTLANVTAFRASLEQAIFEREYTKAIFNALNDPLVIVDAELRMQTANGAFHTCFGISRDQLKDAPLRSIGGRDWKNPELWTALQTVISGEAMFHRFELERDFPVVGRKTFELNACRLTPAGVALILVVFHDITDRLRGQETSALLAAIVESSHDAIISKDLHGVVITWNEGAKRLFGYSSAEMIGQSIDVLIPPDRVHEESYILAAVRRGERVQPYETIRRHKSGDLLEVSLMVSPIIGSDGRVIGASKIATDISARKTLEKSLRDALEKSLRDVATLEILQDVSTSLTESDKTRDALEKSLDAAISLSGSQRGNIQLVSNGYLQIAAHRGFQRPFLDYFDAVHDGEAACGEALGRRQRVIVEDVLTDELFASSPTQKILLDAGVRAVQSTPLLTSSGRVLGMLSTHFDAPHKPSPQDLQALDVLVRQTADFVERVNVQADLREAARRKDEFLATLAHELRNPLASIGNVLQILRMKESSSPELQWATDIIGRQSQQLVRLVDDLLDVSRIVTGKITLQRARTPVAAIISTAVETSRPLIDGRGHQLTIDLPSEEIFVDGDLIRLAQVVANLLHNAAKYTESGGQIVLSVLVEINQVVICVRDNGIGIPSEMLSRIFDMFTQVDRSLERKEGGLGIGLTLVRLLVGLHDGTIEAASAGLGKGSEFRLRLPLSVTPSKVPDVSVKVAERRTRLRILVADDNRDSAETMRALLEEAGNEVSTAEDGEQALHCASHFHPDVVLLDIGMPKINGYDVARRLRSEPLGKDMMLIAITGWGNEEARARSLQAGFNHHLVKPVDFDQLQMLLAQHGASFPAVIDKVSGH